MKPPKGSPEVNRSTEIIIQEEDAALEMADPICLLLALRLPISRQEIILLRQSRAILQGCNPQDRLGANSISCLEIRASAAWSLDFIHQEIETSNKGEGVQGRVIFLQICLVLWSKTLLKRLHCCMCEWRMSMGNCCAHYRFMRIKR